MQMNHYETVFILTPVLSDQQMKDTVEKFRKVLSDNGAEIEEDTNWGLKKLAYPIQHKNSGFYHLFAFKGDNKMVAVLETEYRRDERVLRFLTVSLDKYGVEYNDKRRKGLVGKKTGDTLQIKVRDDKD
jgi:small subunit ribosomal protein S6